jgi:hypothetical protein
MKTLGFTLKNAVFQQLQARWVDKCTMGKATGAHRKAGTLYTPFSWSRL